MTFFDVKARFTVPWSISKGDGSSYTIHVWHMTLPSRIHTRVLFLDTLDTGDIFKAASIINDL